jgi:hypothetical protein
MPKDTFSIQTAATLRSQASEYGRIAARLEAIATTMEQQDVSEITVKGETERERVFRGASAFAQNAEDALLAAVQSRGDHGKPLQNKPKATKKKTAPKAK